MDQLLPSGDIVVRVLAVAAGIPARFENRVDGQLAGACPRLKITKMAEMRFGGGLRIGVVETGQRVAVVAKDRPVEILV
jgi:hypothetical protein